MWCCCPTHEQQCSTRLFSIHLEKLETAVISGFGKTSCKISDSVRKSSWEAQQIYLQVQTWDWDWLRKSFSKSFPLLQPLIPSSKALRARGQINHVTPTPNTESQFCACQDQPRVLPQPFCVGMAQPLPLCLPQPPQQQHRDTSPFAFGLLKFTKLSLWEKIPGKSTELLLTLSVCLVTAPLGI